MLEDHHQIRAKMDPERYGNDLKFTTAGDYMSDVEKMESVELELDNDVILKLSLAAHQRDVTLNQHINDVIRFALKDEEFTGDKAQLLKG